MQSGPPNIFVKRPTGRLRLRRSWWFGRMVPQLEFDITKYRGSDFDCTQPLGTRQRWLDAKWTDVIEHNIFKSTKRMPSNVKKAAAAKPR